MTEQTAQSIPASKGSLLSGVMLVAGTATGAGMLALPFATGAGGFGPAMVINIICWLFMLCTGLLFLECTLWMPEGANVLSMTQRFLGRPGWLLGGASFVFLYYCLIVAYYAGGIPVFREVLYQVLGLELSFGWGWILFTLIFGGTILLGTRVTDRLNFILMIGLIVSYFALIGVGVPKISGPLLSHASWPASFLAIPTLFSAYGYHNIVPSMTSYLGRDGRKLRLAILVGTLVPLVVYALWQWLIIGTVPQDLLQETFEGGRPITSPLQEIASSQWVPLFATYFAFFALTTSLLAVGLSMVDFLGDGTDIPRKGWGRVLLTALVFLPPALFSLWDARFFFDALHYAGGFGEAVLNGFVPVLMVWIGRYRLKLNSDYRLPGGRITLIFLMAISSGLIVYEAIQLTLSFF